MRCVLCLRWFAAASVLRCSHLNRALGDEREFYVYISKF
ncbi:unknow [Vibrio parahaemolyticus]|nr:unknow [Vibrio parahaemolyticus]